MAKGLSTCEHTVSYWRRRFGRLGLEGLSEMPRAGAPRRISDEQVEKVIRTTLEQTPEDATHWSTRSLAARLGVSRQTVHRIWRAFGLQPHRQEVFTLSKDPYFIDKVRDVVGLYRNHPIMRWCSAWMKRAKSKPLNAVSPCCRCGRVTLGAGAMTTIGTAPLRSLPLWRWQPVRSLELPNRVIEAGNL